MEAGWVGYLKMFPDYAIQVDDMLQDGDLVAVFGSTTQTYNGKRGLAAENRMSGPAAWKAIVQDGKVRHWQVYADWTDGWKVIEQDKDAE